MVVAIIALLISILLPSLRAAKQQARTVVCASNLRQLMLGAAAYSTESRGYSLGPNTSGVGLHRGSPYAGASTGPVQDWDFISPAIGRQFGLPRERSELARLRKFQSILMTELKCPENRFRYFRLFQGPQLPMTAGGGDHPFVTSYMTPAFFHLLPEGNNASLWEVDPGGEPISIPERYAPKVEQVGTAASKIYAFEGARYLDTRYGPMALDYSTVTDTTGLIGTPQGNFTSRGPAFTGSSGEPYARDGRDNPTPLYKTVGLRHRDKMNVAFFDGHVEALADRSVSRLQYFAPKGAVVQNQNGLALNIVGGKVKWRNGMIVP